MRLERILETVLYYSSGQEEELARFYGDALGLQAVGGSGLTFRVGEGLLLFFDAELSTLQSRRSRLGRPASREGPARLGSGLLQPDRVRETERLHPHERQDVVVPARGVER